MRTVLRSRTLDGRVGTRNEVRWWRATTARSSCVAALAAVLLVFWVGLLVTPVLGTSVVDKAFDELVSDAEQVVEGIVTAIEAGRSENSSWPVTLVTISDLSVFKGEEDRVLTLRLLGGSDGEYDLSIAGIPKFSVGEHVFLFVKGNGENMSPLVGVWQGRFNVRFDLDRGVRVVESARGDPVLGIEGGQLLYRAGRESGNGKASAGGNVVEGGPVTVEQFRAMIENELDRIESVHDSAGDE